MAHSINGELVPVGGGDNIPLLRAQLTLGRRESCDICLRFPNISGQHCELSFKDGIWFLRDLGSTNGTKVNGSAVQGTKALRPGDEINIATRVYKIQYKMPPGGYAFPSEESEDITSMSLLEKAGLMSPPKRPTPRPPAKPGSGWGSGETDE
jgi:adenylate cyclase